MRKLTLLFLAFIAYNCPGQVLEYHYVLGDSAEFDPKRASCEEVEKVAKKLISIKSAAMEEMREKADSLSKLGYPCYYFEIEVENKIDFKAYEARDEREWCARIWMSHYLEPAWEFTIKISRHRRWNLFRPMYSGKLYCEEDLPPR